MAAIPPRARARSAETLELGGHLFVGSGRRLSAMPGAAIGIDALVGHRGEGGVHTASVLGRGRSIHRRAHERMTEADSRTDLEQPRRLRGRSRGVPEAELLGGAPQHPRIAERLRGGQEQQKPRVGGQAFEPAAKERIVGPLTQ